MIYLRPHHIMCILQFQGYGYDEKFVANMKNVIDRIEKEKIVIKHSFDDICSCCPNNADDRCLADDDIDLLDQNVIRALDLTLNEPIYFKDLKPYLKKKLTKDVFLNICGSCSWHKKGVCSYEGFKDFR